MFANKMVRTVELKKLQSTKVCDELWKINKTIGKFNNATAEPNFIGIQNTKNDCGGHTTH
jgi:hypothetical protein